MLSATRHNMTAAEYFALPAISRSDLELARESLKVYQGRKDGTLPGPSETRALRIGRLFHLAALEPALFERTVTVAPTTDDDFTGTGAKARREAWKALLESWHEALPSGMIVADPAELLTVTSMVHSLRTTQTGAASVARRLLFGRSGESEVTVTWTDSGPDLAAPMACRARLDRLIERAGTELRDRAASSGGHRVRRRRRVDRLTREHLIHAEDHALTRPSVLSTLDRPD